MRLSGGQRAEQRRVWARVDAERPAVRGGGGHGHCPRSLGSLAPTWVLPWGPVCLEISVSLRL